MEWFENKRIKRLWRTIQWESTGSKLIIIKLCELEFLQNARKIKSNRENISDKQATNSRLITKIDQMGGDNALQINTPINVFQPLIAEGRGVCY